MSQLSRIGIGETVLRQIAGVEVPMPLIVTKVTDERIICGTWEFDRVTGAEIDEDLGWGPRSTGSFISPASPDS